MQKKVRHYGRIWSVPSCRQPLKCAQNLVEIIQAENYYLYYKLLMQSHFRLRLGRNYQGLEYLVIVKTPLTAHGGA
jgi:hypothetical protein